MAKTALLIIDMQEFFLDMTTVALPNIVKFVDYLKSATDEDSRVPVIVTQHGRTESDFAPDSRNQIARRFGKSNSVLVGTHAWEILKEIGSLRTPSIGVIAKKTYDAFQDTKLEQVLRDGEIERLLITGVMTDCCVETTARNAFCKGFETWVISDATGSANKEQHKIGLSTLRWACGNIYTTDEAIEELRRTGIGN